MNVVVSSSPHIKTHKTTNFIMFNVILALLPASLAGVFFFGLHSLIIISSSILFAISIELFINFLKKEKSTIKDGSAILTGLILALTLPPSTPIFFVFIGNLVAIAIAKHIFGGLGHNIYNPAAVGRTFLAVSFPVIMTTWHLPSSWFNSSAITTATALAKDTSLVFSLQNLFIGNVPGCLGETSALALLAGGIWLIYNKIIDVKIPLSFFLTVIIFALITKNDPLFHLFSGGIMLGGLFMLTDYVTSPMTKSGKIFFGIFAAVLTMSIRLYSNLPEGMVFSILIMNSFVPFLDKLGEIIHLKLYQIKYKIKK
jgi:Na+-translocating ferredoxin:NAD+ oxidoreductase subunit D